MFHKHFPVFILTALSFTYGIYYVKATVKIKQLKKHKLKRNDDAFPHLRVLYTKGAQREGQLFV